MRITILSVLLAMSLSLDMAWASSSGARVHRITHPVPGPELSQPIQPQLVRPAVQQPRRPVSLNATAVSDGPIPVSERRERPLVLPKAEPVVQQAPAAETPAPVRRRMCVVPLAPREVSRPVAPTLPLGPKPVVRSLAPGEQPVLQAAPQRVQPRSSTATIHRRFELHPVATAPAPQPVQVVATSRRVETRKAPVIHRVNMPAAEKAIIVPPPAPKRIVVVEPPPSKPVLVREPKPVTNRVPHSVVFSSPSQTSVAERALPRRVVTPPVVKNSAPTSLAPQPVPSNRPRRRLPIAPVSDNGALPSVPAS